MVVTLTSDKHVHFFGPAIEPVVWVDSGARLRLETSNSIIERLQQNPDISLEDLWKPIPPEEGNPATGPIYINGAKKGDALAVTIHSIAPKGKGFSAVAPGALGGKVRNRLMRFFDCDGENLEFSPEITIPKRPMIGVIGTAPADDHVGTQLPGDHGGNMDASVIEAGATVYLPVAVPGALLSVGDVHAAMGDGELNGQGIETQGWVDIEVRVIPGVQLKRPMVETESSWFVVASALGLEKAIWLAADDMTEFLVKHLGLENAEAFLLISLAGGAHVCQLGNRLSTARIEIPKACMPAGREIVW